MLILNLPIKLHDVTSQGNSIAKLLNFTIRFSRIENQYKINSAYNSNFWDLNSFLFLTSTLFLRYLLEIKIFHGLKLMYTI